MRTTTGKRADLVTVFNGLIVSVDFGATQGYVEVAWDLDSVHLLLLRWTKVVQISQIVECLEGKGR